MKNDTHGVFHDWYDQSRHSAKPACHTGEYIYLGTLAECAAAMARLQERRPVWRLSICVIKY